jgi:hypothetical protein
MTHDQLVSEIQDQAARRGVLTHYCRRSVTCAGDRGLPDLLCAGIGGACWLEVKLPGDTLKSGQSAWRYTLIASGQRHYVVGPAELADGRVAEILDTLAAVTQAAS